MNKKIIALTQGRNEPSARFRWEQYEKEIQLAGFSTTTLTSKYSAYAPKSKRSSWFLKTLIDSYLRSYKTRNGFDLCFLQRNLVATLPTWETTIKCPYIFDVDDSIFLSDRFKSSEKISKKSLLTICGNSFLANHYEKFSKVEILPTAVNTEIFTQKYIEEKDIINIGWSGSSSGLKFLYEIEDALRKVLQIRKNTSLVIISDEKPNFNNLEISRFKYLKWKRNTEVEDLKQIDIGLMPLEDSLWARGKCSYKMLTYMSIGIPVVVSSVGMNKDVLSQGDVGFGAKNNNQWVEYLIYLIDNISLRKKLGENGRNLILEKYSTEKISKELISIIKKTT